MELSRLVEIVSASAGASIEYQASDLSKRVTLRLREAMTPTELWDAMAATLEANGVVLIDTGKLGLFKALPIAQAPQAARVLLPEEAQAELFGERSAPARASYLSIIVRLNNVDASEAAAAVQPMLSGSGSGGGGVAKPLGPGPMLLLSDTRTRLERAVTLLATVDRAGEPMRVFIIEADRSSAGELAALTQQAILVQSGGDSRNDPRKVSQAGRMPQAMALPDDRRILVAAPASREAEVRDLIKSLDVREPVVTRSYAAPGVPPEDLAASIRTLLESSTGLGTTAGVATGVPGAGAGAGGKVASDRLTGSVLVTTTARGHERVKDLVDRVSAIPASARQTMRAFPIRNREALELASTLDRLLASGLTYSGGLDFGLDTEAASIGPPKSGLTSPDASGVSRPVPAPPTNQRGTASILDQGAAVGAGAAVGQGGTRAGVPVTLSVDEATNTILAVGDPGSLRQVEALITELDKRQPQVMIESVIVSLSESEALSFGTELRGQFELGGSTVNLASLFGLSQTGAPGTPLASGAGFTGTVINPGDFQVVVRALETVNRGRSVSAPKVLVNNNATATLRGVLRQPFTSVNASQTVATTSFGGTQDAGTTITVTPSIARGDHVTLRYAVELSAFTGAPTTTPGGGVVPPPSQQNSVDGSATVPDGFTVVVGGLENLSDSRGSSRLPLLGRIPLLGALFGATDESSSNSRFFVFIRATTLRNALFDDLKHVSEPDLARARIDDGLPTLAPLWID